MGQGVLPHKSNKVLFYNITIKDDFWPELEVGTKFLLSLPCAQKISKESLGKK